MIVLVFYAEHTLECVDRHVKAILGPDAGKATSFFLFVLLSSLLFFSYSAVQCFVMFPFCAVEQTKKECGNPFEILGVVCHLNEG